MDAQNRN